MVFTVNVAERNNNHLLIENIDELRKAFRHVKQCKPFCVEAFVILPDHLHGIWTLRPSDADFSLRWNMLKGIFSRAIDRGERISKSRQNRRERGIWQRKFWAHSIQDQDDCNRYVDYPLCETRRL
nr:transposase [Methylomonas koyamae]